MKTAIFKDKSSYINFLEQELRLPKIENTEPLVIDLFAGCGGLALGFEAAGFRTIGYEMLSDACKTYQHNLQGFCHQFTLTRNPDLVEGAAVIIAGPPCQPFSVGGHQLGLKDSRDGFPIFLDAIERYRPQIALFENVRGMLFRNKTYFEEIAIALKDLGYIVEWEILNAAEYGVPQRRERLFCVAHRGGWKWPNKIGISSPYTVGEALGELAFIAPTDSKFLTPSMDEYVKKYEIASKCIRPRDLHIDAPSRTVTCRNLSAPTGDMLRIRLPDGRRRRLTVREGARLQSFPDWFEFQGSEESQYKQIGNAVPPILAKALACSIKDCLENSKGVPLEKLRTLSQPIQLSLQFVKEDLLYMPDNTNSLEKQVNRKIEEAKAVLRDIGLPPAQHNERSALTLLALLNLKPNTAWSDASNPLIGITPIMEFIAQNYSKQYKPNTRETIRRQTVHQFVEAGILIANPDKPSRPPNSPKTVYQIEDSTLQLIRAYETNEWTEKLRIYLTSVETLKSRYALERQMELIPVAVALGITISLSPGGQNILIEQIINEFCSRFTPGGKLIYIGGAANKWAYFDKELLLALDVKVDAHGKMPDVVVYHVQKNWLVLIEAVTSHGPVNAKRRNELQALFNDSTAGLVFVTAFLSRKDMVKYVNEISWETEVWVAESPTHMIHFNGERFLGPY
jgi:DNA (cytosine-5)-methyltransferase 1